MSTSLAAKQYNQEQQSLKVEIEKTAGKTVEQLYEEREKRVRDAIELKGPDRVPLMVAVNTSLYAGIPNSTAYYDPIGWKRAMRQITLDFEPDMCNAGLPTSGQALEILDVNNRLWPGGPLPPDYEYQFIEGEYMKGGGEKIVVTNMSNLIFLYNLTRML